jgi:anaerobic magnesium-protoporphyrin IX monomethyl ester cyclase
MKLILVEPPAVSPFGNQRIFGGNGSNKSDFRKPPLDLMMISGYLRKEGYENELLDANASRRSLPEVQEVIRRGRPDVVFFSTSTCTIYKDMLIAGIAKEVDPSIVTVAIGTHGMALPEETLSLSQYLDVLIYSSEWEQVALNIVQHAGNLEEANGIYYRRNGDEIRKTTPQFPLHDLDVLGFPAHDKLEKDIYQDPVTRRFPKTMVMGQKACINNCSFCCQPAFFGAPIIRKRSEGHFLEELEWVQKLGFREVMFNDATITADMDWAARLFEGMITRQIDLVWNCSTRADRVDDDILKLMKRAGCHTIAIGMESTDPIVLKNIRKNNTPEQTRRAVSKIRKAGMDSIVYCVIGFPGETRRSIENTISFLKSLDTTYITLGLAVPAPGTDFYRFVEEHGYLTTKDWSRYDPLQKPVFNYPELSAEEMVYYQACGLRQFYLRPTYIFRKLLSIRSFTEAKSNLVNFFGFVNRHMRSRKRADV